MSAPRKPRADDADLPMSDKRRVDDDVRSEVEFHIRERAAELEARGVAPDRAMAEARALFGDREAIEAECRNIERRRRHVQGRALRLRALQQDLVVGLRMLRKTPAFALAAILTLALGIGANAAVFSLVNQTLLKPLAYPHAERLVTITERHVKGGWGDLPWPNFADLHRDARSFDAMTAFGSYATPVLGANQPMRVRAAFVSAGFFETFGVRPERGRLPVRDEHREGAARVAVVSHAFWRDHLGAPQSLTGLQLKLDVPTDVVGVLPPGFGFPEESEIWLPLEVEPLGTSRTAHNFEVVGRLKPGVSVAQGERELSALLATMAPMHAPDFDAVGANVKSLQATMTAGLETPLYLLFAASGVLLLAACTNVASAQLARGTARAGELAVRSALGADRMRLVRQLLTESALLGALGALAGLALAWTLLRLFASIAPAALHIERVHIDGPVMLFAVVTSLATAVLFGLYPALRLSDTNTAQSMRQGGRGTAGRGGNVWNVLVAAEIALAVMLLAGSGVLVRSFAQVMRVDLGFDPSSVTTAQVELPSANYPSKSNATPSFHEAVLSRMRAAGGVMAVGFANRLPLEGAGTSGSLEVEGKPLDPNGPYNGYALYRVVGGDFFTALDMRLVQGRAFNAGDDAGAPRVVIVNEAFARAQWPGQSAIGRRVRPSGMDPVDEPWHTVIGVVANARAEGVTAPYRETYYFDHRQRPANRAASVSYVVRSALPSPSVAAVLRREIAAVDRQVPVEQGTMGRIVESAVADRRFMMTLLGAFAAIALALALVGIYAVVSYTVAQRTREIGVRLALGATSGQVLRMVMSSAMRGVIPGLLAGGALALLGVRTLRSLLYGVSPQDPTALLFAVLLLGVVGVVATLMPARRATRVDPLIAMRAE